MWMVSYKNKRESPWILCLAEQSDPCCGYLQKVEIKFIFNMSYTKEKSWIRSNFFSYFSASLFNDFSVLFIFLHT